jgi:hypothetical protein
MVILLLVAVWPLLLRLRATVRRRRHYRASNSLSEGTVLLRLDRPSETTATFRLSLRGPDGFRGRKEFVQQGRPIIVPFPNDFRLAGASEYPRGKYEVTWEVFEDRQTRPDAFQAVRVARVKDSFTL